MMVNNAVGEGEKIASLLLNTLDELEKAGMSDDMLDTVRKIYEQQLLVLAAGAGLSTKIIEG
jgi:hypothetical protein